MRASAEDGGRWVPLILDAAGAGDDADGDDDNDGCKRNELDDDDDVLKPGIGFGM